MADTPAPRIHAFDWLRGLAVLVMIQTHALVLLRPDLRVPGLFTFLQRLDGLVAPAFIFSAGFSLALVQVRAGLAGKRAAQARKTLRRVLEVLGVASLINLIWFQAIRHPIYFLRLDILHTIAISLLLALPLLVGLSTRPRVLRWVMLGLALAVFALAPFGEQATGFFGAMLNTHPGFIDATTGAEFALLPWAGYVFLGASFGATVGQLKREWELWAWLGLLIGLGAVVWRAEDWFKAAYPPHEFWVTNPANSAQRWTLLLLLVASLRLLEVPSLVQHPWAKWLAAFGTSSLSAYFFHEMLLYEYHVGIFSKLWKDRASWPLFWVLLVALIAATWVCVQAWARLEPKLRARLKLGG